MTYVLSILRANYNLTITANEVVSVLSFSAGITSIPSTGITDSTATGRALITAASASAAKAVLAIAVADVSGLGALATQSTVSLTTQATGVLQSGQMPALTGDVTNAAGSLVMSIAAGAVTLPDMANLAANSVIGNATGSAAVPAAVPMSSLSIASSVVIRDASANVQSNNARQGFATTATAAGTTVLTVASTFLQFFTGTLAQTVTLPSVTTLVQGHQFYIRNNSTGLVTVNSSGGNLLRIVGPGTRAIVTCQLITGTTAASWSAMYLGISIADGKVLTASNNLTLSGTDGNSLSIDSVGATVSGTNTGDTSAFSDSAFTIQDNGDATKQARFEASGLTTGTTRTYSLPNTDGIVALTSSVQTFTASQTFSSSNNTFGSSIVASTVGLSSGAITTGLTKAVNIGTAGLLGSTSNIAIGSAVTGAFGTLTINSQTTAFGATATAFNVPDSVLAVQNAADPTKQLKFDASPISTSSIVTLTAPTASGTIVTTAGTQTLTNKTIGVAQVTGLAAVATAGTFASLTSPPTTLAGYGITDALAASGVSDSVFTIQDNGDATKQVKFEASGITTGTTVTLTAPTISGTLATLNGLAQTFANTTTFSAQTITIGTNGLSSTIGLGTGATTTSATKTVNIGTAGISNSTTNVIIGSSVAGALGTTTFQTPTVAFGATVTAVTLAAADLFFKSPAPATISGAATLTNADIQAGILNYTGGIAAVTFPLGSTLDSLFTANNTALELSVINTGSGIVTLTANTGVTIVGAATVAMAVSAIFFLRRTSASTYIAYRRA